MKIDIDRLIRNAVLWMVKSPKRTLILITLVNITVILLLTSPVAAQEAATTEGGMKFVGAGIAVAGSCIGAGIALQGATSAGLAALTEKPGLAVWVLILAGLAEGVAIYGLMIAILILGA